jgi:hypothetical protein
MMETSERLLALLFLRRTDLVRTVDCVIDKHQKWNWIVQDSADKSNSITAPSSSNCTLNIWGGIHCVGEVRDGRELGISE